MDEQATTDAVGEVIKIVSGDGEVFYLEKCFADVSANIKAGLGLHSEENESKTFSFPDFKGEILEKLCQYLHYKYKHQQLLDNEVINMNALPQFDIPPEMALDVLCAASYLQC